MNAPDAAFYCICVVSLYVTCAPAEEPGEAPATKSAFWILQQEEATIWHQQAENSRTKALSAKEFLDRLCSQRQVSPTRNVRTRARAAITEAPDHQVFGNTQGASKPKSVTIRHIQLLNICSIKKLNQHGQKKKKKPS